MGRFRLRGRFKPPKKLRKLTLRSAFSSLSPFISVIPGAGPVTSALSDYMGDPAAKRANRKMKKVATKHAAGKTTSGRRGKRSKGPGLGSIIARNAGEAIRGASADLPNILGGHLPAGFGHLASAHAGGGGGGHKRMHVTNPKALRRAMRRVEGFAKLAHKTMSFVKHHKLKTRGKRR